MMFCGFSKKWLILLVLLVSSQKILSCPIKCKCETVISRNKDLHRVNCSNAAFTKIPLDSLSQETNILILRNNNLLNINELQYAHLPNLRYLDVCGNPILRISANAFANLNNITELCVTASSFNKDAFNGLSNLKGLTISDNRLLTDLPGSLLSPLSKTLRELGIRNTRIKNFNNLFLTNYTALETVDFTGIGLATFPKSLLSNAKNLRRLLISKNNISDLDIDHVTLAHLDVSYNKLVSIPLDLSIRLPSLNTLKASYNHLQNLSLAGLSSLRNLEVDHNMLTQLDAGQLPNGLYVFDGGHNPWVHISKAAISDLQNLQVLKLQNVSQIHLDLRGLTSYLVELDLSLNCRLTSCKLPHTDTNVRMFNFSNSCLTRVPHLRHRNRVIPEIDIHGNNIQNLTIFPGVKRVLNASHNNINFINTFSHFVTEIDLLDVGHNNITSTDQIFITKNVFFGYVNFTCNKVKVLKRFYDVPPVMRKPDMYELRPVKLDFSFNQITNISKDAFYGIPPLTVLRLNNNDLSSLPDDLFNEKSHLQKLDLNSNNFEMLSENVLRSVPHLSHLLLDKNRIQNLSLTNFSLLAYLKSLSISENAFTELPCHFLLGNHRLHRLEMVNSSLTCNCGLIDRLKMVLVGKAFLLKGHCVQLSTGISRTLHSQITVSNENRWFCGKNCSSRSICSLRDGCSAPNFDCFSSNSYSSSCLGPLYNSTIMNYQSNCSLMRIKQNIFIECFSFSKPFCSIHKLNSTDENKIPTSHRPFPTAITAVVTSVCVIIVIISIILAVKFHRSNCRRPILTDLLSLTKFEGDDSTVI